MPCASCRRHNIAERAYRLADRHRLKTEKPPGRAVAIAAVAIGIALLTEDIIAFSKGKKSLIGELLGDIPAWWGSFIEDVKNFVSSLFSIPKSGLTKLVELF